MDFIKIKYDGHETTLAWEEPGGDGIDRHTLVSKDEPHPDFVQALEALGPVVCNACYLHAEEDYEEIVELDIRGVTLKDTTGPEGDQTAGVTITALRQLHWCSAPLVINTPFAPIEVIPHLAADRLIRNLVIEAEAFVHGKRAQADLFEGDGASVSAVVA